MSNREEEKAITVNGKKISKHIDVLRAHIVSKMKEDDKNRMFLEGMLDTLENLNLRIEGIEIEVGANNAFVDPNAGSHRII